MVECQPMRNQPLAIFLGRAAIIDRLAHHVGRRAAMRCKHMVHLFVDAPELHGGVLGMEGVAFVDACVKSAKANAKWTKLAL